MCVDVVASNYNYTLVQCSLRLHLYQLQLLPRPGQISYPTAFVILLPSQLPLRPPWLLFHLDPKVLLLAFLTSPKSTSHLPSLLRLSLDFAICGILSTYSDSSLFLAVFWGASVMRANTTFIASPHVFLIPVLLPTNPSDVFRSQHSLPCQSCSTELLY
jgi:hypothetical protein